MLRTKSIPLFMILAAFVSLPLALLRTNATYAATFPRCYAPLFQGAGVIDCTKKSDQYHADTNNGEFQNDHCYVLQSFGNTFFYADQPSCNQPPFSTTGVGSSEAIIDKAPCSQDSNLCDFINKYVNPAIDFLGIGFGLIVTVSLVTAGIQYSTSGGDPQKVNNAKKRIYNSLIALLLFLFMFAFLNWLVPGGLLG